MHEDTDRVLVVLLTSTSDNVRLRYETKGFTSVRMWSITSSTSSADIVLAYSAASMMSGPRAWMSVANTS